MKELVVSIQVSSNTVFIRPLDLFVRQLLHQIKPFSEDEQLLDSIELMFNEALVNILEHAYQSNENGTVQITVTVESERLEFKFEDWGKSFDPDSIPDPNLDEPGDGGLGLWFIRQIVDEMHYATDPGGKNVLRLVKTVSGLAESAG
jgi:serine/threonine-protein kinase RsbW